MRLHVTTNARAEPRRAEDSNQPATSRQTEGAPRRWHHRSSASSWLFVNRLTNAPQYAARIDHNEIANPPRPVLWRLDLDLIFFCNLVLLNMIPPTLHVRYKQ